MPKFLKEAIDDKIKIVLEEEFKKVEERIKERKSEIIAGVILYVERRMKIETVGEDLTIIIKNDIY